VKLGKSATKTSEMLVAEQFSGSYDNEPAVQPFYTVLAYFPGVARVFIYPNLIVMCTKFG
jgi:hypothetical protein